MTVTSINDTLRDLNEPLTGVRVEGSFFIMSYGLTEVYFNDQGRQVFCVHRDHPPVEAPTSLWRRLVAAFHLIFQEQFA